MRYEVFELEILGSEALVVLEEVALIVLRGVDVRWARMWKQAHQQVIVRWGGPRSITPSALYCPEPTQSARRGLHQRVVSTAVEDHDDIVILCPSFTHPTSFRRLPCSLGRMG